jgi:ArsR family transcriptional regulator
MDDQGLESNVSDHFGRAPFFTLVDTENNELEIMANPDCHHGGHGQGSCHHSGHLKARKVEAVVTGGMGRGALAGLNQAGIRVMVTAPGKVTDTVRSVQDGTARELQADMACGGGAGHRHGHGHR